MAQQLLEDLRRQRVELFERDGKLVCNAPKGVLTDLLRRQIAQNKPELLRLLQIESAAKNADETIVAVRRDAPLPLSFSQERIYKLGKIEPARNVTGNISLVFRLTGPLDIKALEKAIVAIVERHEVFRASCKIVRGEPTLSIASSVSLDFPVFDLQHLSAASKETEIEAKTRALDLEPFDLEKPPLLRVQLLRLDPLSHVFLLVTHVFVFDGWSTPILVRELSCLYDDFMRDKPSSLPPLRLGYADFASWHRHWLNHQRRADQKAYWKKTLASTSVVTTIVPATNLSSDTVVVTFPGFVADAARDVAKQLGVTLFQTLMGALQVVLQRHTLAPSMAVGTIVSNRRSAATEEMIGSFANNILMRADFPADATFRSVLAQLRQTASTAFSQQDLPFEGLLDELETPLVHNPLFRVMFVFHQHHAIDRTGVWGAGRRRRAEAQNDETSMRLSDLNVEMHPGNKVQSNYLLDLMLTDSDGTLSGLLEYNTGAISRSEAEAFVERYLVIVKGVTTNPDGLVSELPSFGGQMFRRSESRSPTVQARSSETMSVLENEVAAFWKQFLRIDHVDKHDDFYALGGHSLPALALLERLESRFGTNLLEAFARERTIASLARAIEGQAGS